jgi:hypothetical protein
MLKMVLNPSSLRGVATCFMAGWYTCLTIYHKGELKKRKGLPVDYLVVLREEETEIGFG